MLPHVRKDLIKEILLEKKNISVAYISSHFGVSEETVRRDFKELEQQGFLKRQYGGAVINSRVQPFAFNDQLTNIFVENKQIIAKQAVTLINNYDCIFLDSSTTSYYLARQLKNMTITVCTNSLPIINHLQKHKNISLIAIGGDYNHKKKCFIGRTAYQALSCYYFDKCFLSPRSIDIEAGITSDSDIDFEIINTVITHSNQVILSSDHSKFNKVSFSSLFSFDKVNYLITDTPLSKKWIEHLEKSNTLYLDNQLDSNTTDKL